MNRNRIVLIILVDLILLGAGGFQLWNRYRVLQGQLAAGGGSETAALPPLPQAAIPAEPPQVTESTGAVLTPALPAPGGDRKFRRTFSFHNPTAASVQLVGDFNQWTPQDFEKEAPGRWQVSVLLAPGDYSYNLIVDGKVIRDLNQRRTDAKGRSLLTVSP